jgi:hypothetical protein
MNLLKHCALIMLIHMIGMGICIIFELHAAYSYFIGVTIGIIYMIIIIGTTE